MKKFKSSAIMLASLAMILTACGGTPSADGSLSGGGGTSINENQRTIVWEVSEGVAYETPDGQALPTTVAVGTQISFVLKISSGYEGTPVVLVNEVEIAAVENVYKVKVDENLTVAVLGVYTPLSGEGSRESPKIIASAAQLRHVADVVNSTVIDEENITNTFYSVANDIDLGGKEFTPIGLDYAHRFVGIVSGNGHTISNFKVTEVAADQVGFGLFGVAQGQITGLDVKNFNIAIDATVKSSFVYAGGLIGVSSNLFLEGCGASEGQIMVRDQYVPEADEDSGITAYAGGLVGSLQWDSGFYAPVEFLKADVDVTSTVDASAAGGLIGSIYTGYGDASVALSNSYALGDVIGGTYGGGLVGSIGMFTSISNSYAAGDVLLTSSTGSYAGGLLGRGSLESAVINSFSTSQSVFAPLSSDYRYKSHAGSLIGYSAADGYEDQNTLLGTLVYRTFGNQNVEVSGDIENAQATLVNLDTIKTLAWQETNLGWDEAIWTLTNNALPVLKDYADIVVSDTVEVTLHDNFDGGHDRSFMGTRFGYNVLKDQAPNERTDYFFYEWTYDAEGKLSYRAYIPLISGINYYARWQDYNSIAGKYYGNSSENGYFDIANDGTLVWVKYDQQIDEGTYAFDGKYFIFQTEQYDVTVAPYDDNSFIFIDANADYYQYTFTKGDALMGTWLDSNNNVFIFDGNGTVVYNNGADTTYDYRITNTTIAFTRQSGPYDYTLVGTINSDGTITINFNDGYDEDVYDLTFTLQPTIPNYTDKPFVGTYYGDGGLKVELLANGNAEASTNGGAAMGGGYRVYGKRMVINCFGKIKSNNLVYDASKDAFAGLDTAGRLVLLTKQQAGATYVSEKDKVSLYVREGVNYVVRNNQLVSATVTGTIAEGEDVTITILSTVLKYTIRDGKLGERVEVNIPAAMVGEWDVKFPASTVSLVITNQSVTYDGFSCTLVSSTATQLIVKNSYYFTLTITVGSNNTLNVNYDNGEDTNIDGVASIHEEAAPSLVGTWKGRVGSNDWIVIVDENYNVNLLGDNYVGTYNEATGLLTWGAYWSMKLNADGTATGRFLDEDEYIDLSGKLTREA